MPKQTKESKDSCEDALLELGALIKDIADKPPNYERPKTVKDWFLARNVRMGPNINELCFCLMDIARLNDDKNYKRFVPKTKILVEMQNSRGVKQNLIMLNPKDLYRYLMKSKSPLAEEFQDWMFDVVELIRRATITEEVLAAHHKQATSTLTDKQARQIRRGENMTDMLARCIDMKGKMQPTMAYHTANVADQCNYSTRDFDARAIEELIEKYAQFGTELYDKLFIEHMKRCQGRWERSWSLPKQAVAR